MKLALEIPTAHLSELSQLTDFDFALAHRVLEDEEYARFYANRPKGRELLLDNSMHELGVPLPLSQLQDAARRVSADYVIAPDLLTNFSWTLGQTVLTLDRLGSEFKIAVVLCGRTAGERRTFLREAAGASLLCLPYRENRIAWFIEHEQAMLWGRIHLLGVSSLEELQTWRSLESVNPYKRFSVDTSKPLKAALVGRRLDDGLPLRGIPVSSKELLGLQLSPEQLDLAVHNVTALRRIVGSLVVD